MTVIDEVKSRIDIVDVIGQHVQLQRSGRNFRGLCPFHQERTPSFFVSAERQTWHCFGACATGGDAIEFVKRRENVEFPEALRILAARAGVTVESTTTKEHERYDRLYQANDAAASFFNSILLSAAHAGDARTYLRERGLEAETIEAFQLGYAPDEWEALRSHLLGRGFSSDDMLQAGLLVESERGGYDRFRARIMFPIRNEKGRIAGFGGRIMESGGDGNPGAKYLNTTRTAIFDKSALLYGLDRARDAIRQERSVIVVEGYMDVIAAHQHGAMNVVASMGTALTETQIKTLERLRAKILLALDADAAGIEATLRALHEAEQAGIVRAVPDNPSDYDEETFGEKLKEWSRNALRRAAINFYVIPLSGKDPDEMIRNDRAGWDAAVASATPFTDHVFDVAASRTDRSLPAARAALLQELLPVLQLIEEPTHRAHYVQRLARLVQVSEADVRAELARRQRPAPKAKAAPVSQLGQQAPRQHGEEFVLALVLRHAELRGEGLQLQPGLFVVTEHRMIFDAWRQTAALDALRASLPDELHPQFDRIVTRDLPVFDGAQLRAALEGCVAKIHDDRLRQAKLANASSLSEPGMQTHLAKAVETAFALRDGDASDRGQDPVTSELAASLVEDVEIGRRLHRTSSSAHALSEGDPQVQSEDHA
jgi:DNA primase